MTDMPEKIWAWRRLYPNDKYSVFQYDQADGTTEYTRSDLVAALTAERDRLRGDLDFAKLQWIPTPIFFYEVSLNDCETHYVLTCDGDWMGDFKTLDKAKSAAEAHYAAKMAEGLEMVEAVKPTPRSADVKESLEYQSLYESHEKLFKKVLSLTQPTPQSAEALEALDRMQGGLEAYMRDAGDLDFSDDSDYRTIRAALEGR